MMMLIDSILLLVHILSLCIWVTVCAACVLVRRVHPAEELTKVGVVFTWIVSIISVGLAFYHLSEVVNGIINLIGVLP